VAVVVADGNESAATDVEAADVADGQELGESRRIRTLELHLSLTRHVPDLHGVA